MKSIEVAVDQVRPAATSRIGSGDLVPRLIGVQRTRTSSGLLPDAKPPRCKSLTFSHIDSFPRTGEHIRCSLRGGQFFGKGELTRWKCASRFQVSIAEIWGSLPLEMKRYGLEPRSVFVFRC